MSARRSFESGTSHVLLCTERAHYFRRAVLHGCHHVVFVQLPLDAAFYAELAAYCALSGGGGTVETLFHASVDCMRLERVVGSAPAKRMCSSKECDFSI